MKKYTLFNEDGTTAFETNFIPTAMAFTADRVDQNGAKPLRGNVPPQKDVVDAIYSKGEYLFGNGQKLVRNENHTPA